MDELLESLLDVLNKEIEVLRSLISIFERESFIAIEYPFEKLDELLEKTKEKETQVLKLRLLEESRLNIFGKLADQLQISPDQLTLSSLVSLVDTDFALKLHEHRLHIITLASEIKKFGVRNKSFLEDSLSIVKPALSLLHMFISPAPVYHQGGEVKPHISLKSFEGRV